MRSHSPFVPFVCSFALLGGLAASCGSRSDDARSGAASTPRASAAAPEGVTTDPVGSPSTAGPAAADPTGAIVVRSEPRGGAEVAAIVEARDAASVRGTLRVERLANGRWVAVPVHALSLRADCAVAAPTSCVTLREGGALHPPAWNGTRERGQCGCDGPCRRAEAGDYRFVVETCDGARSVASEPFRYAP